MKRLLPAVVLAFASSASCMLDLKGAASTSSDSQSATSAAGGGATTSSATGTGGAGGAQSTSSASSSSTGPAGPVWTRRRKLELDSGVGVSLTGFTILVLLKKGRIDYAQTQDQGQDLRFTDDKNVVLEHEIERWDEGGTSVVWVRIPSLSKNTSPLPTIWMYYGNAVAPDGQQVKAVWSDGYQGVWHLAESGDALSDSSGKTPQAAENHDTTQSDALVGKGRHFDAAKHQYIDTHNIHHLDKFTIEVLVRGEKSPSTSNGPNGPLMRENNYQIMWDHWDPYSGSVSFKPIAQEWNASDMKPLEAKAWYYLAGTYDGTTLRTYKDGVHTNSDVAANYPELTPYAAKIGRHAAASDDKNFFDGDIDEVRIADTPRPDEWFIAQNRSMRDTLVKYLAEEKPGPWNVP